MPPAVPEFLACPGIFRRQPRQTESSRGLAHQPACQRELPGFFGAAGFRVCEFLQHGLPARALKKRDSYAISGYECITHLKKKRVLLKVLEAVREIIHAKYFGGGIMKQPRGFSLRKTPSLKRV